MKDTRPYRIVAGQKIYLVPNGYCQCINADYMFVVCRRCGLSNIKNKDHRWVRI